MPALLQTCKNIPLTTGGSHRRNAPLRRKDYYRLFDKMLRGVGEASIQWMDAPGAIPRTGLI